jgi:hypothetical protein
VLFRHYFNYTAEELEDLPYDQWMFGKRLIDGWRGARRDGP